MKKTVTAAIRIKAVRYGRTINLGNFQSSRVDLEADVPHGRTWQEVLAHLQAQLCVVECEERTGKRVTAKPSMDYDPSDCGPF
jgi:hypothetical protein